MYQAHDTKLNRDVALKSFPRHLCRTPIDWRDTREAHILASLNHPNIAAILRVGGRLRTSTRW